MNIRFSRVFVEVAGVVHVDVGGAAPPALGGHVGDPAQPQGQVGHVARRDLHARGDRLVLEAPDGLDFERSHRQLHPEAPRLVKGMLAGAADPREGVRRGVETAVGGGEMNPRGHLLAGRIVHGAHREHAHRPAPVAPGDLDDALLPAVRLEERELRQPPRVVNVGDPLAVRRPARMEGVVLEERQLVGRAAVGRLDVEVRELVGGPGGGGIDEPLAVNRDGPDASGRATARRAP